MMIAPSVLLQFGLASPVEISPLTAGLINQSFKVNTPGGNAFFLQQVNAAVFTQPQKIQENYRLIQQHLSSKGGFEIPVLVPAGNGDLLYEAAGKTWRCFHFLPNTYSPQKVYTAQKAYEVANCFGQFTAMLHDLPVQSVHTILPNFHHLPFRYQQLMEAWQNAAGHLQENAKDLMQRVDENQYLLKWYKRICGQPQRYPVRIMHHDCKISNILFDKTTDCLVCPIDLDTTQPGLFFSDLGDMVRTIVPSLPEDAANVEDLTIRTAFYDAAVQGYLDAMAHLLTPEEKQDIHYAGAVLVYMQAIRFLGDYLNNNAYYKVSYATQNWDRAANQFALLRLLQAYTSPKK